MLSFFLSFLRTSTLLARYSIFTSFLPSFLLSFGFPTRPEYRISSKECRRTGSTGGLRNSFASNNRRQTSRNISSTVNRTYSVSVGIDGLGGPSYNSNFNTPCSIFDIHCSSCLLSFLRVPCKARISNIEQGILNVEVLCFGWRAIALARIIHQPQGASLGCLARLGLALCSNRG